MMGFLDRLEPKHQCTVAMLMRETSIRRQGIGCGMHMISDDRLTSVDNNGLSGI